MVTSRRRRTRKVGRIAPPNVVTARRAWQRAPADKRAPGAERAAPGMRSSGDFYHVEVRPKREFRVFRTHDVGREGGIERVDGRRADGSWATQKWLIGREHAHVEDGCLVADTTAARKVLDALNTIPRRVRGDRFKAGPGAEQTRPRVLTNIDDRRERRLARRAHGERPPPPAAPRS